MAVGRTTVVSRAKHGPRVMGAAPYGTRVRCGASGNTCRADTETGPRSRGRRATRAGPAPSRPDSGALNAAGRRVGRRRRRYECIARRGRGRRALRLLPPSTYDPPPPPAASEVAASRTATPHPTATVRPRRRVNTRGRSNDPETRGRRISSRRDERRW